MRVLLFKEDHIPAFGGNWKRFLFWGILLMILGLFAIGASVFTTLLTVITLGFLIFIGGAVMLVDSVTFWWKKWGGFFLHLILALLYLIIGLMLIKNPVQAAISLTLLLGIFYMAAGIFRLGVSAIVQMPRWGWSWLNGLISLVLGVLILMNWPASSLFIIGLFVGIDLFFTGWAYTMAAIAGKNTAVV